MRRDQKQSASFSIRLDAFTEEMELSDSAEVPQPSQYKLRAVNTCSKGLYNQSRSRNASEQTQSDVYSSLCSRIGSRAQSTCTSEIDLVLGQQLPQLMNMDSCATSLQDDDVLFLESLLNRTLMREQTITDSNANANVEANAKAKAKKPSANLV